MNRITLAPFVYGGCIFEGGWLFEENGVSARFLLGKNGCGMLLDESLSHMIQQGTPSQALRVKMAQHALVHMQDAPHWGDRTRVEEAPICPERFIMDLRDMQDAQAIMADALQNTCAFLNERARHGGAGGLRICFSGGEPLEAADRIKYVLSYFQNKPYRVEYELDTDARLAALRIARTLCMHQVRVNVRLEGANKKDTRRVFTANAAVENGVRVLQSAYGHDLVCTAVVTRYNAQSLPQMAEYWKKLGITHIRCELAHDELEDSTAALSLCDAQTREFAKSLFVFWEECARTGVDFDAENIRTRWENLTRCGNDDCCLCRGCTAGRRCVRIDMRGDLFPCGRLTLFEQKLGSIYDETPLELQLAQGLERTGLSASREKGSCGMCPWRYYCRGGCMGRMRCMGKTDGVDETECALNQTLYPLLVRKLIHTCRAAIE